MTQFTFSPPSSPTARAWLQAAYWNSKYSQFYITRYSMAKQGFIQVGKPRSTIEAALAAAIKMDKRNPKSWMTFIDVVKPTP